MGLVATDDDCTLAPSPVASVEGQGSDDSAQRRGRPDRYDSGAGRLALSPVGPVFMVLGGVSMGLAAISWAVADPIQRDLRVRCVDRGVCPFDVFARADAVRALDTLTNVGLIGGGVLMTTGLILLLAVRVPSGVTTSSVAVAPTLGGLSLHATF